MPRLSRRVAAVLHLTARSLARSPAYAAWLRALPGQQVLLCGAGSEQPGLGFLASARLLARLNAVSRRVFPLPPALALRQAQAGSGVGSKPESAHDAAGRPRAGASEDAREPGRASHDASERPLGDGERARGAAAAEPASAHAPGTAPAMQLPAGGPRRGAGPAVGAGAGRAGGGAAKVVHGALLMRLAWSGARGMEVDTCDVPAGLDVGALPAAPVLVAAPACQPLCLLYGPALVSCCMGLHQSEPACCGSAALVCWPRSGGAALLAGAIDAV
jgi:hypothetical protein